MDRKHKTLYRLLSARHDGRTLTDDELATLEALLDGDEAAQFDYFRMERLFHDLECQFMGNCAETVIREFPKNPGKILPLVGWSTAIAASLVAALLLVPRPGTGRDTLLVKTDATILTRDDQIVARVVGSQDLGWGAENSVEIANGELKPGLLDLERGTLDVVLDNGTRLGFVAPVRMDLSSLRRLALLSGELVLDVPGLSEGLTVTTPDAVLTANTALTLIRSGGERTDTMVKVERGAVDLFTEDETGREVRKSLVGKESVEIARGTADPVMLTKQIIEPRVDLSQPPELKDLKYVHYNFDEPRGATVRNLGNIPNGDGWLDGIAEYPEYPMPKRVPGRFGRALQFTGHGEGARADLKEFGTDEPGSVAFWIKIDPETTPSMYETIFTWRMYSDPEKSWHADDEVELACSIHINDNPDKGVVGALWIAFRNRWICGSKDLRDGRWHHVTAVFLRGYQGKMVRHYIDGQLARSSARGETWLPQDRYPEIGGGSISIGRVYWDRRPGMLSQTDSVGLRGLVDEVYVFNQAVLPSHASRLFMENSPNQKTAVSFVPWSLPTLATLPVPVDE
ncbi:hypothetical protein PDESU_04046 [Pontiella desulfatans]|uniref:FecR protein domain-containing protein n=1 Tax=Pontiella desulfatans TaxID=2750659 RepID=A0A6C2U6D3_PONDE|nr:LamG domain-containing protein [Pontiella desulfatans]VGO15463.1 hypothetical protein PDESU_04046 [Pontiella desulfatans]